MYSSTVFISLSFISDDLEMITHMFIDAYLFHSVASLTLMTC